MKTSALKVAYRAISLFVLALGCISIVDIVPLSAAVQGDTIYMDVKFPEPTIAPSAIHSAHRYTHIAIQGLDSFGKVGEPVLPVKGLKVLIPTGKKIKNIDIVLGQKVALPGRYYIEPGQKQYPLSLIDTINPQPDEPKSELYTQDTTYPTNKYKLQTVQEKVGYPIAMLTLFPVEYNPRKGEISYYQSMSIMIRLEQDIATKSLQSLTSSPRPRTETKTATRDRSLVNRLIDNKEDLQTISQTILNSSIAKAAYSSIGPIAPGQYDYVIITSSALKASFDPLINRIKTRWVLDANGNHIRNFTAITVTTDWIDAHYPGNRPDGNTDKQTKIRNFIIDAFNYWGTEYVLLAGNGNGANAIIPARGLADATDPGCPDMNIPADLYYACLNGTFDHNANGIYGEPDDGENGGEVDLVAEVYVGRALVSTSAEAAHFVTKTLAYENSTDPYLKTSYMLGEYLGFGGVANYATAMMEEIRLGSDSAGFVTKGFLSNAERALDTNTLYASPVYTWEYTDLIPIINSGVHILNHLGHANNSVDMRLDIYDVNCLTNTKYFIVYSQGCYPGAFDNWYYEGYYLGTDCIAKYLTTNAGGAVAFIGNSRYGWGYHNSTAGSSQYYNRQFWDALFNEGIAQLGKMNQDSKEDNIPYLSYSMNRWCYFELNLFGDPALAVHTPNDVIVDLSDYTFRYSDLAPGENVELVIALKALNQTASNVSAVLTSVDPYVTITQPSVSFDSISSNQIVDATGSPLRFTISEDCPIGHLLNFTLQITAEGYAKEKKLSLYIPDPQERRITTDLTSGSTPVISGNYIVWEESRGYMWTDIHVYNLATQTERTITTGVGYRTWAAISGSRVVWEDYRNGSADIYLYDLSTNSERRITSDPAHQGHPAISGNYIVWCDWRNDDGDIYMYDLATGTERRITTDPAEQSYPAISGNYIVWQDERNGNYPDTDIYLYDLSTSSERPIAIGPGEQCFPAISGNNIVWEEYRNNNLDIYLYDITMGTEHRITTDPSYQYYPVISGNRIVWQDDRNGNYDIYLYDLSTNSERGIATNPARQGEPVISGNYIVWQDERNGGSDIYLYDLIPPVYSLTVATNPIGKGTVTKSPNKATYTYGEVVTLTATPNTGYSFGSWTGGVTGTTNPVTIIMNGNKSVTANFTQNAYTLAITASNGTVTKSPNKATYTYGEVVTLTATPNTGYSFGSWTGVGTSNGATATVTMNGNKSVRANFTQLAAISGKILTYYGSQPLPNVKVVAMGIASSYTTTTDPNGNYRLFLPTTAATYTIKPLPMPSPTPTSPWDFYDYPGKYGSAVPVTINGANAITVNFQAIDLVRPSELFGCVRLDKKGVFLSWKDNSTDETGFRINRFTTDPAITWTTPVAIQAPGQSGTGYVSFADLTATKGVKYWYRIKSERVSRANDGTIITTQSFIAGTVGPITVPAQ